MNNKSFYKTINEKIEFYNYKNEFLSNSYMFREIELEDFYYYIFGSRDKKCELPFEEKMSKEQMEKLNELESREYKYNSICVEINQKDRKKSKNYIITTDLEKLEDTYDKDFVITSPLTYIGRNRNSNNARMLYALTFDLDGLDVPHFRDLFYQFNTEITPIPNIIVNSGNGLHLYYILKTPIGLFSEEIRQTLNELKRKLTNKIWTPYTSTLKKRQYQNIYQGYRLPGTKTKFNTKVKAYFTDEKDYYTLTELNGWIYDKKERLDEKILKQIENGIKIKRRKSKLSLKEAKELYPNWYEEVIIHHKKKKWDIAGKVNGDNPFALYDWWFGKIQSDQVQEGHRYHSIMCLVIYAIKCDVPYERLEQDCYSLLPQMESLTENEDNHFTSDDIADALRTYKDCFATFPISSIEYLSGIPIEKNKRNGLKQRNHLEIARAIQEIKDKQNSTNWRDGNGRPKGSGIKKDQVQEWRANNPNGKKIDCSKETGLHINTVYKWWNATTEKEELKKYPSIPPKKNSTNKTKKKR